MICFDNHSRVTVLVLSLLMYLLTTTTLTTLSLPHLSDLINNAHVNLSPMTPLDVISYLLLVIPGFGSMVHVESALLSLSMKLGRVYLR